MTGQQLIDRMVAFLRNYVAITEGQALVCALWALNTWVYERFAVVPYLEIWGVSKRVGKNTLGEMLAQLSCGGTILPTVRVLQMVRIIEAKEGKYCPFMDEAERFHKGALGDDRSILATGYRKGAFHEITDSKGGLLRFRTYCPKAFMLIGNVHEIIRDRCISIRMERGVPQGNWTLARDYAESEATAIVDAWKHVLLTLDATYEAGDVRFKVVDPDFLMSGRDREIWSPIFSIAHALKLHKASLDLLTRAAVDLSALKQLPQVKYHPSQDERVNDDASASETLLRDVLRVVQPDEKVVSTEELLKRLQGIDTAPWRSWRGMGLDAAGLAALLIRFGISSKTVRVGKGRAAPTRMGYAVADIIAAKKA